MFLSRPLPFMYFNYGIPFFAAPARPPRPETETGSGDAMLVEYYLVAIIISKQKFNSVQGLGQGENLRLSSNI